MKPFGVCRTGRCYERESVPYKALDSLVDSLCRLLLDMRDTEVAKIVPEHMQELARLFPVLKRLESLLDVPWFGFESPDPHEVRRRAFGALRELFARIAASRPLVLYIDDVQWGDTDSAALLRDVLRPPGAPALMLIVSYRSGDVWSPKVDQTEALKAELECFIDCIEHDRVPVNDGAAGLRVVRLLEAAEQSLEARGKIVPL